MQTRIPIPESKLAASGDGCCANVNVGCYVILSLFHAEFFHFHGSFRSLAAQERDNFFVTQSCNHGGI